MRESEMRERLNPYTSPDYRHTFDAGWFDHADLLVRAPRWPLSKPYMRGWRARDRARP